MPFLHPRGRRYIARLAALSGLASALVVVSPPTLVQAQTHDMSVRTEHVALGAHAASRKGEPVSAALAAEPTVRQALLDTGRRATKRTTAPFQAIGITVPTEPSAPIFVRARVAGDWTPWVEADFTEDEAPDPGTEGSLPGIHSQPIWMGPATAYEVDSPGAVARADVHLVSEETTSATTIQQAAPAGAATAPSILSRSAWGARSPKQHPVSTTDLKLAIVHHSVNANSYSAAQVPSLLRSIQAYHQDVRGWDDIAYNFAVDRFGRTWEARAGGIDQVVLGGHSAGFNTGSVGVVVLGDFTSVVPPPSSLEAVANVIAWKFALHRVDPASKVPYTTNGSSKFAPGSTVSLPRIVGHRDVQTTSCPGAQLYARLGTIRQRVAQLVPSYQADLLPSLIAADLDGDGLAGAIEQRPGAPTDTIWRGTGAGAFAKQALAITKPYRAVVGDFDGNGLDDVVWHGTGSTPDAIWWSRPGGMDSESVAINASYVPFVGDFDGNGLDDVFWYSTGLASDAVWYFEPGRVMRSVRVAQDLITGIPIVGDFDGDHRDDIFWYAPGAGDDAFWWSAGRSWTVRGLDVNGFYIPTAVQDTVAGRDEIVFIQPGSTSYRWEINSARQITSRILPRGLDGKPTVGDFDGDGREDVFIRATVGPSAFWYATTTGVDVRSLTVGRPYELASGPMDTGPTDDILLVSPAGADYLWRGNADRTITSAQVG